MFEISGCHNMGNSWEIHSFDAGEVGVVEQKTVCDGAVGC